MSCHNPGKKREHPNTVTKRPTLRGLDFNFLNTSYGGQSVAVVKMPLGQTVTSKCHSGLNVQ
jgi:hypothetical protein